MDRTTDVPAVSVVIPVRNGGRAFRHCLDAVARLDPRPIEVVVVDDGSTDDSGHVAEASGATVISLPTSGGPGRARNVGARTAHGDVLFFVDADVSVHPDAVARVTAAFENAADVAAVFGSYDDTPGEPNFLSQYKNLFHHYVHQRSLEEAATFWAGCGAIRRAVFLEMGGFDENFDRPSIEDIELGYRLKRAGHRIRLCKALQGTHLKRWTALSLLRSDFFDRALPWTRLIQREGRMVNDLNLRWPSRASVVGAWALVATLIGGCRWPASWSVSLLLAGILLALNAPVYGFFFRKRGLRFTLGVVPWHWLYYFYGGLAYGLGVASVATGRLRRGRSGW